jgi:hypothetical protein
MKILFISICSFFFSFIVKPYTYNEVACHVTSTQINDSLKSIRLALINESEHKYFYIDTLNLGRINCNDSVLKIFGGPFSSYPYLPNSNSYGTYIKINASDSLIYEYKVSKKTKYLDIAIEVLRINNKRLERKLEKQNYKIRWGLIVKPHSKIKESCFFINNYSLDQ